MTINSDISIFFDDFFAIDIAAITDQSFAVSIKALFDEDAELIQEGVISVKPRIIVKTEDVKFMNKNWSFRINGKRYDIFYHFPDNQGIREIYLTEHNDE